MRSPATNRKESLQHVAVPVPLPPSLTPQFSGSAMSWAAPSLVGPSPYFFPLNGAPDEAFYSAAGTSGARAVAPVDSASGQGGHFLASEAPFHSYNGATTPGWSCPPFQPPVPLFHGDFYTPMATTSAVAVFTPPASKDKFACQFCGQQCAGPKSRDSHERTHTGERPFQCELCPSSFRDKIALGSHRRKQHPVRSFKCDDCNKSFSSEKMLALHHATHTDLRAFKCRLCPMKFVQAGNRRSHECLHVEAVAFVPQAVDLRCFTRPTFSVAMLRCEICQAVIAADKKSTAKHARLHTSDTDLAVLLERVPAARTLNGSVRPRLVGRPAPQGATPLTRGALALRRGRRGAHRVSRGEPQASDCTGDDHDVDNCQDSQVLLRSMDLLARRGSLARDLGISVIDEFDDGDDVDLDDVDRVDHDELTTFAKERSQRRSAARLSSEQFMATGEDRFSHCSPESTDHE